MQCSRVQGIFQKRRNRHRTDAAIDSRHLGPIPRTAIIGTVVGR